MVAQGGVQRTRRAGQRRGASQAAGSAPADAGTGRLRPLWPVGRGQCGGALALCRGPHAAAGTCDVRAMVWPRPRQSMLPAVTTTTFPWPRCLTRTRRSHPKAAERPSSIPLFGAFSSSERSPFRRMRNADRQGKAPPTVASRSTRRGVAPASSTSAAPTVACQPHGSQGLGSTRSGAVGASYCHGHEPPSTRPRGGGTLGSQVKAVTDRAAR